MSKWKIAKRANYFAALAGLCVFVAVGCSSEILPGSEQANSFLQNESVAGGEESSSSGGNTGNAESSGGSFNLAAASCEAPAQPTTTGNTFYIDPVNGSSGGDGSAANPWRTLSEVEDDLLFKSKNKNGTVINSNGPIQSGDLVLLKSGDHGWVEFKGYFNDDFVTIAAAPGHSPKVAGFRLRGGSFWRLQGLTLEKQCGGSPHSGIVRLDGGDANLGGVSNIELIGNTIQSIADASGWSVSDWLGNYCRGIDNRSSSNVLIKSNVVRNVAHGITLPNNSIIDCNTVYYFGRDGMVGGGSNIKIRKNFIGGSINLENGHHDDGIQFHKGANPCNCNDVEISDNQLLYEPFPGASDPKISAFQGIGLFDGPYANWVIANNVVRGHHWHGITANDMDNSTIAHNTVYGGANHGGPASIGMTHSWIKISGSGNTVKNNLTSKMSTGGSGVSNNIEIDPGDWNTYFNDLASNDFSLKAGCPAIDTGEVLGSVAVDIDGNGRGSQPDVGAYEFQTN